MVFYLKNPNLAFVTVAVGQGTHTISPGETVGPFDGEDITTDIQVKSSKRIINVIVPKEGAKVDNQIEPESDVDPADIEDVETEEY